MWTCQEVFLEVELGSQDLGELVEPERALSVGRHRGKGWRGSRRESRWSTGCGKHRRLDKRGNREPYRLWSREVTRQQTLSGSTKVLSWE